MVAFIKILTDERVAKRTAPFDHPELLLPHGSSTVMKKIAALDDVVRLPETGRAGGIPFRSFEDALNSGLQPEKIHWMDYLGGRTTTSGSTSTKPISSSTTAISTKKSSSTQTFPFLKPPAANASGVFFHVLTIAPQFPNCISPTPAPSGQPNSHPHRFHGTDRQPPCHPHAPSPPHRSTNCNGSTQTITLLAAD